MIKINYLKTTVLFTILICSFITVLGQDKTLVGKVTTFDSIPLMGVTIEVKSTGVITTTDSMGRFQVFCNQVDRIKVNADGFSKKKVKIKENIRLVLINLNLKGGKRNFEQAARYVNVGYGYVSSEELLYAVSSADNNEIDFTKYDSVLDAIQGAFPGVMVENGEVVVRGVTTIMGAQGNGALVVIDGIISNTNDLENLSPHDVKSIDILKDGSASVYGSRGANGVVIVSTKKGNN